MQSLGEVAPPANGAPVDLSAHGTVTSVLQGALEGGCMANLMQLGADGPELAAQTKSLFVNEGSKTWDVEYLLPAQNLPDFMGKVVDVKYHYRFGGFGPTQRSLSVVSEQGASIYQVDAGDLSELAALPVQFSRGSAVCFTHESCGSWSRFDLFATAANASVRVPHGGTAQLAEYSVVHGGYAAQTSSGTACADWYVADLHVALVRAE